jgi:hypothetical protein
MAEIKREDLLNLKNKVEKEIKELDEKIERLLAKLDVYVELENFLGKQEPRPVVVNEEINELPAEDLVNPVNVELL